jgi:hypothetical protein
MTIMQKILWIVATLGNFASGYFYMYSESLLSFLILLTTLLYSLIGLYDVFLQSA